MFKKTLRLVKSFVQNNSQTNPRLTVNDKQAIKKLGIYLPPIFFPRCLVNIDKCVDVMGIKYCENQHFFTKSLALFVKTKKEELLFEHLNYYYENFKPKNLAEIFSRESLSFLSKYPPIYFFNGMPWSTQERFSLVEKYSPGTLPVNYGPVSEEYVLQDAQRLIDSYKNISEFGYKPWQYNDGFIRGFILVDEKCNDYRVVITSGRHRMPSLLLNNYKDIQIRLEWNSFLPVIFQADLLKLPQVQSGRYSEAETRVLINYFFNA